MTYIHTCQYTSRWRRPLNVELEFVCRIIRNQTYESWRRRYESWRRPLYVELNFVCRIIRNQTYERKGVYIRKDEWERHDFFVFCFVYTVVLCMRTYIRTCKHMHTYIRVHTCVHTYTHTHVYIAAWTHRESQTSTSPCAVNAWDTYIHAYVHTLAYIHTHVRSNMNPLRKPNFNTAVRRECLWHIHTCVCT